jgi:hypothetical protein
MALLNVGTGGQVSTWLPAGGRLAPGWKSGPFRQGVLLVEPPVLGKAYALLEVLRSVLQAFGAGGRRAVRADERSGRRSWQHD